MMKGVRYMLREVAVISGMKEKGNAESIGTEWQKGKTKETALFQYVVS